MKIKDFLVQLIADVEASTPSGVDVRIRGGDQNVEPDEVVIDYDFSGIPEANGHKSLAGTTTDANGYNKEKEYHQYMEAEVRLFVRMYDEIQKDGVVMDLMANFSEYQSDAGKFHADTRLWRTPSVTPSDNAMFDPDWYESVITVPTQLVHKTLGPELDALESIDVVQTGDEPDDRYIEVN